MPAATAAVSSVHRNLSPLRSSRRQRAVCAASSREGARMTAPGPFATSLLPFKTASELPFRHASEGALVAQLVPSAVLPLPSAVTVPVRCRFERFSASSVLLGFCCFARGAVSPLAGGAAEWSSSDGGCCCCCCWCFWQCRTAMMGNRKAKVLPDPAHAQSPYHVTIYHHREQHAGRWCNLASKKHGQLDE